MSDQESHQKPPQSENEAVQEISKVQNAPNSSPQQSPQHQKLDFMSPYDIDISQYNPTSNSKTSSSFSPYDLELPLQSRNQNDPQANQFPSSNQVLQQFPQADGDFKQNSSQLFPYMGNNSDVLVSMTKDQRIKKERNIIMKYYRKFCDPIEAGEYKNARNKVMFV